MALFLAATARGDFPGPFPFDGGNMLTRGNHKLGGRLIWSFSLPSGRPDICTGMSELCRRHCYSLRLEGIRPAMRARYEANYRLSQSPAFERRVRAFLVAHGI